MVDAKVTSALDPLRRELNVVSAVAVLRLQADEELQARYECLAERNTEGQLSPEETAELASLVEANLLSKPVLFYSLPILHNR